MTRTLLFVICVDEQRALVWTYEGSVVHLLARGLGAHVYEGVIRIRP